MTKQNTHQQTHQTTPTTHTPRVRATNTKHTSNLTSHINQVVQQQETELNYHTKPPPLGKGFAKTETQITPTPRMISVGGYILLFDPQNT